MINILEEASSVSSGTTSYVLPLAVIVIGSVVAFIVINEIKKRKK